MPERFVMPKSMRRVVDAAIAHRRAHTIVHDVDTGGSPFVTMKAAFMPDGERVGLEVRLTWHTRSTGTYRFFSGLARGPAHGWQDVTITRAVQMIEQGRWV